MTNNPEYEMKLMEKEQEIRRLNDSLNEYIMKYGEAKDNYKDLYDGVMAEIDKRSYNPSMNSLGDFMNELDEKLGNRKEEYDKARTTQPAVGG